MGLFHNGAINQTGGESKIVYTRIEIGILINYRKLLSLNFHEAIVASRDVFNTL